MAEEKPSEEVNLAELFDLAGQLLAARQKDKSIDVVEIHYRWDGSVVVPPDLENILNESRTQHG